MSGCHRQPELRPHLIDKASSSDSLTNFLIGVEWRETGVMGEKQARNAVNPALETEL